MSMIDSFPSKFYWLTFELDSATDYHRLTQTKHVKCPLSTTRTFSRRTQRSRSIVSNKTYNCNAMESMEYSKTQTDHNETAWKIDILLAQANGPLVTTMLSQHGGTRWVSDSHITGTVFIEWTQE